MTKEQAKEAAAVMLAWAEGKAIQVRRVGRDAFDWIDITLTAMATSTEQTWDWVTYEYRIKPQPREWWMVKAPSYGDVACLSEQSAKEHVRDYVRTNAEIIHVREVLE